MTVTHDFQSSSALRLHAWVLKFYLHGVVMTYKKIQVFAPFFKDAARRDAAILSATLTMLRPWRDYWGYCYIWGIGPNINKVPRHNWHSLGSATEQFARLQRLIEFMDSTGCSPMSVEACPKSHLDIELLDNPDHMTWWLGPQGEPLVLLEPYLPRQDIQLEIFKKNLTAYVMPNPGIYGGGGGRSTSVFLTLPQYEGVLQAISRFQFDNQQVSTHHMRWMDALALGKGDAK
jgi:hypothetical protein